MPISKEYDYSSVEDEEDAFLDTTRLSKHSIKSFSEKHSNLFRLLCTFVPVTSLLIGVILGISLQQAGIERGLTFADMSHLKLYDNVDFEPRDQRFNGSLFKRSAYSGPPTPEMDETWGRFTEAGSKSMPDYPPILNISIEDARASTSYSLETAVHLNETQNMGYMASLGFFHQIHCLNMLRRFIYLDYYEKKEPGWFSQPYLRGHADHCVDMLRESIMCHGDSTLIVYHWIKGYTDPVPDFSTVHTCRDPEAILSWMQENQIILQDAVYKHGEKDLPEIF